MAHQKRSVMPRYTAERLNHIAFPMGGMGAGMICLEGAGAFSHVSLRHQPEMFHEPLMFAALQVKGAETARMLEGPAPMHKAFGRARSGGGSGGKNFGLPRFAEAAFEARFPFARVALSDAAMPVKVELTGWSPFAPPDADSASLPVAGLEYRLTNRTKKPVKAVFSFHAKNFMKVGSQTPAQVVPMKGGFVLDVPRSTTPPHVASWQMSRLFPKSGPVTEAACVRLADALDWQPAPIFEYFANAHQRFSTQDGITYIGTRLKVSEAGKWIFSIGHDGPMRMFIDGQPAAAEGTRKHPHRSGRTEVPVSLAAGEHEVMFAFDLSGGAAWGVSLAFRLPEGVSSESGAKKAVYPTPEAWTKQSAATEGSFAAFTPEPGARTDCAWFRGAWFDSLTVLWNNIAAGRTPEQAPYAEGMPSNGGSLYVPVVLKAGASRTVRVMLAWYVPRSELTSGGLPPGACGPAGCGPEGCGIATPTHYVPWYATRFASIDDVATYWREQYEPLRERSQRFSDCFFDTTLPAEAVEAAAANLAILKSPTVLRQHDGRLWGWEGSNDTGGCCAGSCTHVWNYAQALCHLFPTLERSLRETEFVDSQDERGHQNFRSALPIRPTSHEFHAAADGQLGSIMKVFREWRISGDTAWMKRLWPRVRRSLDYCITTWDPDHTGTLIEPHHNTYDIEFWGADGMCTSFYLGAMQAAIAMGEAAGDDVTPYRSMLAKGKRAMETTLWNGEYFIQRVQWEGLRAADPTKVLSVTTSYTPEALKLLEREGPKYQYGKGCLSDGVLGDWLARVCQVEPVLDEKKVRQHMESVHRYNFRASLADHANPQRPGYAFGQEAGLLLCSWPKGGKLSLPFVYSDEVWTGIEHQVAAHLIMLGRIKEGLQIVRAVRQRYNGEHRNPFNEYECGHWYARAMSSYSLLQAFSGARYDAVDRVLHIRPAVKGDFTAFLSTATGYGTVGVRRGKPFLSVKSGDIFIDRVEYKAAGK